MSARRAVTLGGVIACAVALVSLVDPSGARTGPRLPWIAYQAGGIRLVHPYGSDDHRASASPAGDQQHPDWSPNGRMLVFDVDSTSLWSLDLATGTTRRLYRCTAPCAFIQDGAWSPDGRPIAFVQADTDARGETTTRSRIVLLRVTDGAPRTVWTSPKRTDIPFAPRWSPSGKRLVFELDRFVDERAATTEISGSRIGIVAAGGGTPTWLTGFDAVAMTPDWNRHTGSIVFAGGSRSITDHPTEPSNLFSIAPDGTALRRLTRYRPPAARAIQPTWTPDGRQILFTYVRGAGSGSPVAAFVAPDGSRLDRRVAATHPRLQP